MKKQDISEKVVNLAYLSIGTNLGNKLLNIKKAKELIEINGIKITISSSLYKTPSWPNKNFPEFLNTVIKVKTAERIETLFKKIKNIEKKLGRKKSKKNYPRVCDIDIIDFNNKIVNSRINDNNIIVPHKRMHTRNFVLFPLFEINRNWTHPKLKKNIVKLLSELSFIDLSSITKL